MKQLSTKGKGKGKKSPIAIERETTGSAIRPTPATSSADTAITTDNPGCGQVWLDLQPDHLVQGVILAEILGKPRCRRSR